MKVGSKISGLSKEMLLANIGIIEFEPLALLSAAASIAGPDFPPQIRE